MKNKSLRHSLETNFKNLTGHEFELIIAKLNRSGQISDKKWFYPTLILICMVVLIARKSNYTFWTQPFNEDGTQYLSDAVHNLWGSIFGHWAGYIQVVPNLVAWLSVRTLGLPHSPLGLYISGIIIAAICAAYFSGKQFRFIIRNDMLRSLCSFFIIVAPIQQVYVYNIALSQFFLTPFLFLFTMLLLFNYEEYRKKSRLSKISYAILTSVSYLTSIFSVVFLIPIAYVIWRELKTWNSQKGTILSFAIPIIPLLTQLMFTFQNYFIYNQQQSPRVDLEMVSPFISLLLQGTFRIFYSNIMQFSASMQWIPYALGLAVLATILFISKRKGLKIEVFTISILSVWVFLMPFIRNINSTTSLGIGSVFGWDRYTFFLYVFILILLVRQFDRNISSRNSMIFIGLMFVVVINIVSGFVITPFTDVNFPVNALVYNPQGSYDCVFPISPYHDWIDVPCLSPMSINKTVTAMYIPNTNLIEGERSELQAIVTPAPSGGWVEFLIDGRQIGDNETVIGGQATLNLQQIPLGEHLMQAFYSGYLTSYPSKSGIMKITMLSKSQLAGKNLSNSDLHGMDFTGNDLSKANFSHSNLVGAIFDHADLEGSDLFGADSENASFKQPT